MSRFKLNKASEEYSEKLIAHGWVDSSDQWSFSSSNGNIILRSGGWDLYSKCHLGVNSEAPEETRERFGYPVAKVQGDHVVLYKRALDAIRQRGRQEHEKEIFDAAGELLERVDKKKREAQAAANASTVSMISNPEALSLTCAVEFEVDQGRPWDGKIVCNKKDGGEPSEPRPPRFRAVAHSGEHALKMSGYKSRVVFDNAGINVPRQKMPVHMNFDKYAGIGHTEKIRVDGTKLVVEGVVSRWTPEAEEFKASISRKNPDHNFPWRLGMLASPDRLEYVEPGERAHVNNKIWDGPLIIARESTLADMAFCDVSQDHASWVNMLEAAEATDAEHEDACVRAAAGAKIRDRREVQSLQQALKRIDDACRPFEVEEMRRYNAELEERMQRKCEFRRNHGPARLQPMGPTPIQMLITENDRKRQAERDAWAQGTRHLDLSVDTAS